MPLTLIDLGWTPALQSAFDALNVKPQEPARVVEEQRGRFVVQNPEGEYLSTLSGRFRHGALRRDDFPAVGDWVAIKRSPQEKTATIQSLLPRTNKLSRKAPGQDAEEQLIAANIHTVFVVSSLNKEFDVNRVQRYVAMGSESGAEMVIVLSKADLCTDPGPVLNDLRKNIPLVPAVLISASTGVGLDALTPYLQKSKTVVLMGSSGVGKSSLVNWLLGRDQQLVNAVRPRDDQGRHTTTCRRLVLLPQGTLLIDTPGMRELHLWDTRHVADTYDDVIALISECKFKDCRHHTDAGCAVQKAIIDGNLPEARYRQYVKLGQDADRLAHQLETEADRLANEKVKNVRAVYKRESK